MTQHAGNPSTLSNADLLRMANSPANQPPQTWYEGQVDPFKPEPQVTHDSGFVDMGGFTHVRVVARMSSATNNAACTLAIAGRPRWYGRLWAWLRRPWPWPWQWHAMFWGGWLSGLGVGRWLWDGKWVW